MLKIVQQGGLQVWRGPVSQDRRFTASSCGNDCAKASGSMSAIACFASTIIWKVVLIRRRVLDMKAPPKRAVVLLWLSLTALSPPAWCANDQKDGWDSLKRVPHGATLIFADRSDNCLAGRIKSYDSDAIVVTRHNESDAKIDRSNVLRITTNAWESGLVYNGRSSWLDVVGLVPIRRSKKWRATVLVEMNTGENARGQLIDASQGEITLRTSSKSLVIARRQISTLSYVRPQPLSDLAEYANDELAWMRIFDPQLWPTLFHAQGSLVVRIYDVNLPQDDSPIVCKEGAAWHTLNQPVP